MKYTSLLFSFVLFAFSSKCQWKGYYDTTKIVGFCCVDKNCTNAKFFRGYTIEYNPTQKELKAAIQKKNTLILPEEKFLDDHKNIVLTYPITFYYYNWK